MTHLSVSCLFVISEQAGRKIVNRLIVHLGLLGIGDVDECHMVEVIKTQDSSRRGDQADRPLPESFDNHWADRSVADTEQFMIDQYTLKKQRIKVTYRRLFQFLVLDDQRIRGKTIILVSRGQAYGEKYDEGEDEDEDEDNETILPQTFKKARIPSEYACLSRVNLDLGNADCDEVVSGGEDTDHDDWWIYHSAFPMAV